MFVWRTDVLELVRRISQDNLTSMIISWSELSVSVLLLAALWKDTQVPM